jgi:hypothetical protein
MSCGHRGKPNRQEEKRISRLLRKSGFIPMLEELYGLPPPTEREKEPEKSAPYRDTVDVKRLQKPSSNLPQSNKYIPPILPYKEKSQSDDNQLINKIKQTEND